MDRPSPFSVALQRAARRAVLVAHGRAMYRRGLAHGLAICLLVALALAFGERALRVLR